MSFGDVVNQFLDEHGFSDSGSSEKPDFTSSGIRSQQIHNLNLQVNYLNSRDKQFGTWTLILETGSISMNWIVFLCINRSSFIDGLSDDINDSAQSLRANWNHNGISGVFHTLTSN